MSADIIAGRLQGSQAGELRSFAVLNLAWSSIVKLLLSLASSADQNGIADSKHCYALMTKAALCATIPLPFATRTSFRMTPPSARHIACWAWTASCPQEHKQDVRWQAPSRQNMSGVPTATCACPHVVLCWVLHMHSDVTARAGFFEDMQIVHMSAMLIAE